METREAYWHIAVFLPFLDGLLTDLNTRFSQLNRGAVQGLVLLPHNFCKLDDQKISQVKAAYLDDLPEADTFVPEVALRKRKWTAVSVAGELPKELSAVLDATNSLQFPNISTILNILTIIPVTTATVERGNSALRFVKTDLRSTMEQEQLNSLMLLYIHKDIALDYDSVIDSFAAKHPRRLSDYKIKTHATCTTTNLT